MSNTAARKLTMLELLSSALNLPREAWKRLVNIVRGVKDVSPLVAQDYIVRKNALILDVREQHEYDAGHVPHSVLIPLGQLTARLSELEAHRGRTIVVICHGGKRSATACHQLLRSGFHEPLNIAGGILAWKRSALPVEI